MNKQHLLPHRWKRPSWFSLLLFLSLGLVHTFFKELDYPFLHWKVFNLFPANILGSNTAPAHWTDVNIMNTILGIGIILSALAAGFSAERNEDEYVAKLRLAALSWALIVNYILLLIAFVLLYDFSFIAAMEYNLFTVLLLFVFRFRYLLYRSRKSLPDEK